MKTHYIRLGPAFENRLVNGLRSLCGYSDRETPLTFVPRGRPATCVRCTQIDQALKDQTARHWRGREERAIGGK